MNTRTKELALIALLASLALGLAWRFDHDYFAIYFATAAAIAISPKRNVSTIECAVQHVCRRAAFDDNTVMMFYLRNLQR